MNLQASGTNTRVLPGAPQRSTLHISGKNVPDGECHLVGIDAGTLYVRVDRRIADNSPVTVSFEHTDVSGYVTGCQSAEDDWVVSIALTSGRRQEARIPTGGEFTIGIVGNKGTTPRQCTVIDRSASGLGLRFSRPVAPGTRVYVEVDSVMALGEIRHCRKTSDGEFVAGMSIAEFIPDVRQRGKMTEILHRLRWKLTSGFRRRN